MTDDHKARLKQHADMFFDQEMSMPGYEPPGDLFFNVFCDPNAYPEGEKTKMIIKENTVAQKLVDFKSVAESRNLSFTVGRHLACIDHVMASFWNIEVKRNSPTAKVPTRSHTSDAGWDLYADETTTILTGERRTIYTGISLGIPDSFVGLIWPRSGMAVKQGVDVLAGVIDSGYRGIVKVCLLNTGYDPVVIEHGDRIAQILFQEVPQFKMVVVDSLEETDRGEGGFGSTGN